MKNKSEENNDKIKSAHKTVAIVKSPEAITEPENSSFGRSRCTVCSHVQIEQINKLIAENHQSFRATACQFGLNRMSVNRHVKNCLNLSAAAVKTMSREEQKKEFHTLLRSSFIRIEKLISSTEDWLSDPDNPDEYLVAPRADEITVVYDDYNDCSDKGEPKRKVDLLDDLLMKLSTSGREVVKVRTAAVDNRKLLIESLSPFTRQMQLYAKVIGIEQAPTENEQMLQMTVAAMLEFFDRYPDFDVDTAVETYARAKSIDKNVLKEKFLEARAGREKSHSVH